MSETLISRLSKFDPSLPLSHAHTIPSSWYHDPAIQEAERSQVFGNSWQVIGRVDQVRDPGSFFTADLAGEPILVVRDETGTLRGFYNVCRHRAARVMELTEGCAKKLRCRYHGWTYDLAGKLKGTPEFDGVADFPKVENGLPEVAVAAWGPLVWVNLGQAPGPLTAFLLPLPEQTLGLSMEELRFVQRREYRLACNWKIFVDNYLDGGYHVNTVHPGLAGVIDYSGYRTEIHDNCSVQISPLKRKDEGDDVGKVRSGANAYYWWVYPNFMMNLYEGVMDTNLVLPIAPDACRVIFDFYFANPEGEDRKRFIAESMSVGHQIQLEDVGICEEVQRGLASRSYDTGRFSVKREAGGYHFHQLLAKALNRKQP